MTSDVTLRLLLLGEDKTASKAIRGVGKATDDTTAKMGKWGTAGAVMKGALAAGLIEKAAGAVLFIAFVIVPPSAAYLLTDRLWLMLVYGAVISIGSSVLGSV